MKTDLKPGCVRVFICEECGEAFLESVNAVDGRYHVRRSDGCDQDCGPITERILADPDVVRRETIEELLHNVLTYDFIQSKWADSVNSIKMDHCQISGALHALRKGARALADAPREEK